MGHNGLSSSKIEQQKLFKLVLNRMNSNLRAAQHSEPLEILINTPWHQTFTAAALLRYHQATLTILKRTTKQRILQKV